MTDVDRPAFAQTMNRLCIALREKDPDAVQMRVYFEALKDLEIEFVSAAGHRLEASAKFFPKPAEWRLEAGKVERERIEAQRAVLRKLVQPLCAACDDTGWDRTQDDRVVPCDCRTLRRLELLGRRPMPQLPSGDAA